ncbi:MAG: hypothetical protein M0Z54_09850 [Thermaerobacter sp.]|nr:hypothetical protein [Thermaerobacter sp.]
MATQEDWRAWWERECQMVPPPAARLLARVTPGPDTVHWLLGAQRPAGTAAAVVRRWLEPPDTTWAFIVMGHAEVLQTPEGALIGFSAPDADNPVPLAHWAREAVAGQPAAAVVADRLAEGTAADEEEARRCLLAALPPHWPPEAPPMGRGAILAALADLQAAGHRGLEALAVKAIEASTLTRRWRALEAAGAAFAEGGGGLGAG